MRGLEPMDPAPAGTGMTVQVTAVTTEALRLVRDGLWDLPRQDAELAQATAAQLAQTVGPAVVQERLAVIKRLEHLREAIAAIAIAVARTHGRLAWFLAQAATALTPVLHWRALPAEHGQSFGTTVPGPDELTDAEDAVRRLRTALTTVAGAQPAQTGLAP